jgi:hypothetical protein
MANYTKQKLSGSTSGKMIKVSASGSAGANTIHTAIAGSVDMDEIWLYAQNLDTTYKALSLMWGGSTYPDDWVEVNVPPQAGLMLVIPGLIMNGSNVVKAYADEANVVTIGGFVNRIMNSGS